MTLEQLRAAMPYAGARASQFFAAFNLATGEFDIDTPRRQAAFIAQCAHESGSLRYTAELASGAAYEGRADLGNTVPGFGVRYKGRGLLQITGRANYRACAEVLGLDLLNHPELLEAPEGACRSAGWFWLSRRLNELADDDKFGSICRSVNGGYNGLDDRIFHWLRARKALGL